MLNWSVTLWNFSRRFFVLFDPFFELLVHCLGQMLIFDFVLIGQIGLLHVVGAWILFSNRDSLILILCLVSIVALTCHGCLAFLHFWLLKIHIFNIVVMRFWRPFGTTSNRWFVWAIRALALALNILTLILLNWKGLVLNDCSYLVRNNKAITFNRRNNTWFFWDLAKITPIAIVIRAIGAIGALLLSIG